MICKISGLWKTDSMDFMMHDTEMSGISAYKASVRVRQWQIYEVEIK